MWDRCSVGGVLGVWSESEGISMCDVGALFCGGGVLGVWSESEGISMWERCSVWGC